MRAGLSKKECMMKRSICCSIFLALAISSCTTFKLESRSIKHKITHFLKKHSWKIAAGLAAAAAIGIVALKLNEHADKTEQAIRDAGIRLFDDEYETAVIAVGLLGPLGEDRTLKLISLALDKKIISRKEAAGLIYTDIGAALANYFDVTTLGFRTRATVKGIGRVYGATVQTVNETISKLKNNIRSLLSW